MALVRGGGIDDCNLVLDGRHAAVVSFHLRADDGVTVRLHDPDVALEIEFDPRETGSLADVLAGRAPDGTSTAWRRRAKRGPPCPR